MDLLCTECAKVFAKEVDLIVHQARAHDTRHFTCTECQAFLVGKDQQRNHMRQHMRKEKSLSIRTCTLCPYETKLNYENQGDEEVEEVTVSTNIDHLDSVDVGDLVVIPFDPLTEDPLTSEHPNDSLPLELTPND